MKIIFICRGNVGRSQMAEALFRKTNIKDYEVSSAGTRLSGPEQTIESLMPKTKNVISVMDEEGVDIRKNTRVQISEEFSRSCDRIILTIDENDPVPEYLKNNPKVEIWNIDDPKGKSVQETREIKNIIKEKILLNFLK